MRTIIIFTLVLVSSLHLFTVSSAQDVESSTPSDSLIADKSAESIAKAIHSTIKPHRHRKAIRVALRTCASCKLKDLPHVKDWIINRAATFGVIVEYSGSHLSFQTISDSLDFPFDLIGFYRRRP